MSSQGDRSPTNAEVVAAVEVAPRRRVGERLAEPLTRDELALEAEAGIAYIDHLIEIGAVKPRDDGRFERGDVIRARVIAAFEAEGFSLDQMATAIREGAIAIDVVPLFYPDPSLRSGRTFGQLATDLGERGRLVGPVLQAMGLSGPRPDAPTREIEERLLRTLIEGWASVDDEYTLRAARIFGDAARRAADGWVNLFTEAITRPVETTYTAMEDVVPRLLHPAAMLSPLSAELLGWLLERHLERAMNDVNIDRIEARLQQRGLIPARPEHPPAVAFVDVSEYTRLTYEQGDEHGALTAVRLAELADRIVRRHAGRVAKLLGDGVLLLFDSPCTAVQAVGELMAAMVEANLPPAHAGVHAGPIVERDGDIYGTTVNLASRIAEYARPGVLLVSDPVVQACPQLRDSFEPLAEFVPKGLDDAIWLCKWVGSPS